MAYWDKLKSRGNVQDRRAWAPATFGATGVGLVGFFVILIFNFLGPSGPTTTTLEDILQGLQQVQGVQQQETSPGQFAGIDQYEQFAATVLGSTNDMWRGVFRQNNRQYNEPQLVLFRAATQSACGGASAQSGPHYCPADKTIYLDETFFTDLRQRYGAQGDVAEAYVIAHEAAHHAQSELGIADEVNRASQGNAKRARDLSIKLELQADCFAGMWAKTVAEQQVLEPGEIREAMDAAAAVGDDRIQQTVQGRVTPETWTHGSSEQRVQWFNTGYAAGRPSSCNTFEGV